MGDPTRLRPRWQAIADFAHDTEAHDRFWKNVERGEPDECWPWRSGHSAKGYGHMAYAGFTHVASRLSWAMANGRSPADLFVCHRCDNPPCVNPAHLFLGTATDNARDMVAKGRNVRPDRDEANIGRMRGERSNFAVLQLPQVFEIRKRYDSGERIQEIANDLGYHKSTVGHVATRRSWKHV